MNVGYYFHPRAVFSDDGTTAKTEAHWAMFIRGLAADLGQVTFYAHPGQPTADGIETTELGPEWNIQVVNIGPRRRRPLMYLFPGPNLRHFKPKEQRLDAMIVRGPTSLLPAFARRSRRNGIPALGLLVDDTSNWQGRTGEPRWRVTLVKMWLFWQRKAIARVGRKSLMMSISKSIVRDRWFKRTVPMRTSSFSKADLTGPAGRTRPFPIPPDRVRLLFAGRIALEKGVFELCDAMELLVNEGYDVECEFVGALYPNDRTVARLKEQIARTLDGRVTFRGFLEAGPELLGAYHEADVYVLPTWGEGAVTRTIREAFATGLPVVTTTIREITEFLTDGVEAVLVPKQDPRALADGIKRVIDDPALRDSMTKAGFEWVQDYTNEASVALVAGYVRDEVARGVR